MAIVEDTLLEAAKRLHFVAGDQWKEFLTALKVVEAEAAEALVRAPQDQLTRAQGRAQMIRDINVKLSKA